MQLRQIISILPIGLVVFLSSVANELLLLSIFRFLPLLLRDIIRVFCTVQPNEPVGMG